MHAWGSLPAHDPVGTRRGAAGLSHLDYVLTTSEVGTIPVRVQWRDSLSDHGVLVAQASQARACTPWALARLPPAAWQSLGCIGLGLETYLRAAPLACPAAAQVDTGKTPGAPEPGEAPDLLDLAQGNPDGPPPTP